MFVPYIEDFFQFMNSIGIEDRLYDNNNTSNNNHILSNKKIVMSGSKSKTLKNKFKEFSKNVWNFMSITIFEKCFFLSLTKTTFCFLDLNETFRCKLQAAWYRRHRY